jgi:hypothetical protein
MTLTMLSQRIRKLQSKLPLSEFLAARTCVEQIVDLRNTLRCLGEPVRSKSYMIGDNESVVNIATQPHGKLHERLTCSPSITSERLLPGVSFIMFTHIPCVTNPSDISANIGDIPIFGLLLKLCSFGKEILWILTKP